MLVYWPFLPPIEILSKPLRCVAGRMQLSVLGISSLLAVFVSFCHFLLLELLSIPLARMPLPVQNSVAIPPIQGWKDKVENVCGKGNIVLALIQTKIDLIDQTVVKKYATLWFSRRTLLCASIAPWRNQHTILERRVSS